MIIASLNSRTRSAAVCITCALLIAGGNALAKAPTAQKPATTAAKQSAGAGSQLGTEVRIGAYKIKPPKSFVLSQNIHQGAEEMYIWKGPAPDNPAILLVKVTPAAGLGVTATPEVLNVLYKSTLLGMSASIGLANFHQDPSQAVTIDGIPFARGHWSGANSARTMSYGFTYVSIISGKAIALTGTSTDPDAFRLAELSAVTFRR